ncbi:LPS export ABC transporter permease LptF [Sphingobium sp. YR768]|jgi:lipopolysaccharide export system permease protein|uniref:LPS export ABC transporter permease LptF n=1 Tax=Sphingobium sp. YR768 TaxID=1884365 RepID=UPI0008BE557B|nr:LPS export ABC transporter permease LptF [Sphingobium sp. YR768]SEQ88831.1 lipopolysaccharide export system permease protein [Sphingobium sp. YR768]
MLTATDRYLARLIAVPMIGTLVIAAMLFMLDKMLSLFDFVAAQGGPVSVVWRMLANMLPEYMSLAIPIGLMLGILLAFRKLATTSELDVMRAVGLSYGRLLRVPYMYAIALALINFGIVGFVQPLSRHAYEALRFELRSGALGASIKVGEFTTMGKRMTMRIERSRDEGRNLQGIFVRANSSNGQSVAVTAAQGTFLATDDPDTIIFRLRDGVLVNDGPKYKTPRILSFSSHDLPIDLPQIENFRGRDVDREKTIPELVVIGRNAETPQKLKDEVRANFHYRMVEVVFMLLLPLAALAFAIPPKRSTSALGVFLSIIFIVTYHKINQYGESVGALGKIDPIFALWGPFLVASALVLWMYHVIAHRPGGQPIGALEYAFGKLGKQVVRLLSLRRRRAPAEGAA